MSEKSVVERIIERMEKEKKLVSNYDYISWLENFTLTHESFKDDSWLYTSEEIPKEDLENVQDLDSFSEGIKNLSNVEKDAEHAFETFASGGDISVHDVMIASQKSNLAMQMAIQLRNQMLNAYNEFKNMSV